MMKKFAVIVALFCPFLVQAEIWKDYSPSEAVTELVVMNVKPNYADTYLMQLKDTWVAAMEVMKERGDIVDYNVWVTNSSSASPNVFLTTTFKNMGAMQGSEARYDAVNAALEEMGIDEDENEETAKGYEDIREVVDYKILHQITYK